MNDAITRILSHMYICGAFLLAIDGRCAAGKTTLATNLSRKANAKVIHMDDFFLRPGQRTEERLKEPGGNVDYERFREEVMIPLYRGEAFSYRPYDCRTKRLLAPVFVEPGQAVIVEGSYSCHPALWDFYDLRIFLDVGREQQISRIEKRNGKEGVSVFRERWIPLEENYLAAYRIKERCDLCFCLTSPIPRS